MFFFFVGVAVVIVVVPLTLQIPCRKDSYNTESASIQYVRHHTTLQSDNTVFGANNVGRLA
eukprot:jgi/Botrbrau1/8528/Bobra.0029s0032.1